MIEKYVDEKYKKNFDRKSKFQQGQSRIKILYYLNNSHTNWFRSLDVHV